MAFLPFSQQKKNNKKKQVNFEESIKCSCFERNKSVMIQEKGTNTFVVFFLQNETLMIHN